MEQPINCKSCHRSFEATRPNSKFCSSKCFGQFRRKKEYKAFETKDNTLQLKSCEPKPKVSLYKALIVLSYIMCLIALLGMSYYCYKSYNQDRFRLEKEWDRLLDIDYGCFGSKWRSSIIDPEISWVEIPWDADLKYPYTD